MAKHILHCSHCDAYTMQETCKQCGAKTISKIPPKYSPEDKYGRYRREVKEEMRKKEGII
jgi:H/ACA ribonucleoprotein complex subunit 3